MSFSLSNSSQKLSFFAVLMYALYGNPGYSKFKRKHQQFGLRFQTVIPYLMTMICMTLCMFIGEIWLRNWPKRFRVIFVSRLLKNPFLQRFFSLRAKLLCFLYSIASFFDLDFIAFIFNWEYFIIAECSALLTWGVWLPRWIFLSFAAYLSKTPTKLFSKVQYSYELRELVVNWITWIENLYG